MGVLYFTSWLRRQQDKAKISFIDEKNRFNDNLFIDGNGAIYGAYNSAYEEIGDRNIDNLESLIIKKTLEHYTNVINMVKPKKDVYISIDGIAPFAKITQQRIRRYTSYMMDKLDGNTRQWQANSNISPSTNFMKKLDIELKKYCKENNYIYSSYEHKGEGEHKIIQAIKSNYLNENNIIYSSDTDIIFLSLITLITKYKFNPSSPKNIYLFRLEEGKPIYFNVYKIKLLLIKYIKYILNNNKIVHNLSDNELILDFIILCFIIGNDFLQNIPFITANRMNYIITSYGKSLKKFNDMKTILYKENNNYKINYYNLSMFIKKLSKQELELFKVSYFENALMNHNHNYSSKNKDFKRLEELREQQKDYIDFNNFDLSNYIDEKNNYIEDKKINVIDILINYKFNYYTHYLHSNNTILINNLLKNYLNGFDWTINYYFNTISTNILEAECLNWNWYYKFNCMPFISDISNYLENNFMNDFHIKDIKNNKPLTFEEQLIYIIPYNNLKQVNNELSKKLEEFNYISPEIINIDTIHKTNLWSCHCIISLYDSEDIRKII